MNIKFRIFIFILFFAGSLKAQVVFVPLQNPIYSFLERMDIRYNYLNEEAKPFSRKEIANFLGFLVKHKSELNKLETEELDFYLKEFAMPNGFPAESWKLFKYKDPKFSFTISPIIKYGISFNGDKTGFNRSWGAYLWGTYSNWFGASLNFTDNGEYGKNVNRKKFLTPRTGHWNNQNLKDGIEYSDVRGSISFNWSWGSISLMKDYFTFGSGEFGKLIISTKAPDYPNLRLELHPVKWFSFYYFHGWLTSDVNDSIYFFPTFIHNKAGEIIYRKKYINKYIAANYALFKPLNWLNIGLGNSVIYDREIRPEFLIPFMLYKFLDHDMGLNNDYGSNGQLFFDVSAVLLKQYKFYSSVFVDDASIREVLKGNYAHTWIGYTLGTFATNILTDNLDLKFEYTRINPWVYEHYIPTTTYKNINYNLGHWIGQNADLLRFQLDYKLIRGLDLSLYYELVRKGGLLSHQFQYDNITEKFLYGPLRVDKIVGFNAQYEYLQDLKVTLNLTYSNITDEDKSRTPSYLLGKHANGSISFSYGF